MEIFIFKGTIGRFDFPNSSAAQMKKSLNKILKWKDNYNIYPGHGDKTTLFNEIDNITLWEKYKMRNFYETITQFFINYQSVKKRGFDEIFEFLQFNFKIDSLKIYLKKSGISSSVF